MTAFPSTDKESSYWFFALAEVLAFSGEKDVAAGSKVTALDSVENPPQWGKANLVDGFSSTLKLMAVNGGPVPSADILNALHASSRRWELELALKRAKAERQDLAASLLEPALRSELEKQLSEINQRLADLPPSRMVYAGASDFATTGNFHPSKGVRGLFTSCNGERSPRRES